jgi:hypothetical protein
VTLCAASLATSHAICNGPGISTKRSMRAGTLLLSTISLWIRMFDCGCHDAHSRHTQSVAGRESGVSVRRQWVAMAAHMQWNAQSAVSCRGATSVQCYGRTRPRTRPVSAVTTNAIGKTDRLLWCVDRHLHMWCLLACAVDASAWGGCLSHCAHCMTLCNCDVLKQ